MLSTDSARTDGAQAGYTGTKRAQAGHMRAERTWPRYVVVALIYALYVSWTTLVFRGAPFLDPEAWSGSVAQVARITYMVVVALSALLAVYLKPLVRSGGRAVAVLAIAAVAMSAGAAFCAIKGTGVALAFPSVTLGLAIAAIGAGAFIPFYGIAYAESGPKATAVCMLTAYIVSAFLVRLVWNWGLWGRFWFTVALPFGVAVLVWVYFCGIFGVAGTSPAGALAGSPNDLGSNVPSKGCPASTRPAVWRQFASCPLAGRPAASRLIPLPGLVLAVACLSGFLGMFVQSAMAFAGIEFSAGATESFYTRMASLVVLLAIVLAFGRGYDTYSVFWPFAILVLLVSCLALPFVGEAFPAVAVAMFGVAHIFLNTFNFTLYADLSTRLGRDPAAVFCWGKALDSVGCVLGLLLGFLMASFFSTSVHFWYIVSIVCSITIVLVSVLVVFNQRFTDLAKEEEAESSTAEPGLETQCEKVAREYGLSAKETEILALLARGRSVPFIADELLISPSTAKTHTRNIYRKLDVHSRQELLDLVYT